MFNSIIYPLEEIINYNFLIQYEQKKKTTSIMFNLHSLDIVSDFLS